jgi:hypothetical protein
MFSSFDCSSLLRHWALLACRWDFPSNSSAPPQPRLLLTLHTSSITLLLEAPHSPLQLISADESGSVALWEADTGLCLANAAIPAFVGALALHTTLVYAGGALLACAGLTASVVT